MTATQSPLSYQYRPVRGVRHLFTHEITGEASGERAPEIALESLVSDDANDVFNVLSGIAYTYAGMVRDYTGDLPGGVSSVILLAMYAADLPMGRMTRVEFVAAAERAEGFAQQAHNGLNRQFAEYVLRHARAKASATRLIAS